MECVCLYVNGSNERKDRKATSEPQNIIEQSMGEGGQIDLLGKGNRSYR